LINQYKDKGDIDKVGKHVTRIKSSVAHLTSILNDFLSLGKLDEGRIEINREPILIGEFLAEVREELLETLKVGQEIAVHCTAEGVQINSDVRILRNMLFNLISNASKYSDQGKKIFLSCDQQNGKVEFRVRDEGIGIPEEDLKHMFERFFRASNAGNIQGTGLGLNIVKRYAELLNGSVSFTSRYGEGSIFSISLPL
jgi:signal transduction histidine kinase